MTRQLDLIRIASDLADELLSGSLTDVEAAGAMAEAVEGNVNHALRLLTLALIRKQPRVCRLAYFAAVKELQGC